MAKRNIRLNPGDSRAVDAIINDSRKVIDELYQERQTIVGDIKTIRELGDQLAASGSPMKGVQSNLASMAARVRSIDGLIESHNIANLKGITKRFNALQRSPRAGEYSKQIDKIGKDIFRLSEAVKADRDVREMLSRVASEVSGLSRSMGVDISDRPSARVALVAADRENEQLELDKVIEFWKAVTRRAKRDPRLREEVEHINVQLRSLSQRISRESIKDSLARVVGRIRKVRDEIKLGLAVTTFEKAQEKLREFSIEVKERAKAATTRGEIDKLRHEIGDFASQFTAKSKADWDREDLSSFGRQLRELDVYLDRMRVDKREPNPKKPAKKASAELMTVSRAEMLELHKRLKAEKAAAKGKGVASVRMPQRLESGYVVMVQISPKPVGRRKAATLEELHWDADLKPLLDLHGKEMRRTDWERVRASHGDTEVIYAASPEQAAEAFIQKLNEGSLFKRAGNGLAQIKTMGASVLFDGDGKAFSLPTKGKPAKKGSTKKSSTKKVAKKAKVSANPARRKPSPATRLISRCHKLWEAYTKKPTKKALKEVVNHLDKMRTVTGERIKKEVSACSKAVSKEARRLNMAISR